MPTIDKDAEQKEPSFIAGENASSSIGRQFEFSK
jgi:hypothetical protein